MSAQIADFNLRFNADTVKFQKDVDYAKKMLRGYTKEAKAANDSTGDFDSQLALTRKNLKEMAGQTLAIAGIVSTGIGSIVAASTYMVRQTAEQAREIERMATVAQVSVEQIQALGYASEQYSISGDKMADIIKDTNDKLGDFAANGAGEFKDFMTNVAPTVGLTIAELQRLSGPEALIAVKTAMDELNVPMKQQLFYLESIANDASALMPLLENKGARLYELTQRYDDLNVAMSKYDIAQFKQMDQQIGDMELRLSKAFADLSRQVSYSLLPAMDDVTQFVVDITKGVKDYTKQIEAFGLATATMNVMGGKSLREKHRETFADIVKLKEDLAKYSNVDVESLPSINPLPGGRSRNEWFNLQRELGAKQETLKRINDQVIAEQKRLSENFKFPGIKGANDDSNDYVPPKPAGVDRTAQQQAAGAAKLQSLDMQYASERDQLLLAHEQRLADIENLNLSEQDLRRRGYESLDAIKLEYKEREDEYYLQEQEEYQRRQDEAIQRELDAFTRKEEAKTRAAEQASRQRAETEKRLEQQVIGMKMQVAGQTLGLIEQTAKEGSAIQKAAFLAQKVMAAMQVVQQGEVAAMAAMSMPPIGLGPIAGAGMAGTIRMMSAASAGMIMGQAIAGMAHNGIGEIPAEGTWLLDKGERVYTNYSAQQIDQMYAAVMSNYRQPANDPAYAYADRKASIVQAPIINIHNAPPGTYTEESVTDTGQQQVDVFLADMDENGPMSQAIGSKFGLARQGV
ncbi:TPA: hypothetical protein ACX6RA_003566 [Photobacterium damselae]